MKLTTRQQEVLDYLHEKFASNGVMPSTREIQEDFGFASQTAAVSHLRALERKGVIERDGRKARSIRFAGQEKREALINVPIYGSIPAGYGDDTKPESEGCLSVDVRSVGVSPSANAYALRVRGESMIDAHILDGDHVILENKDPKNLDIVAALIDGETTLKRYVVDKQRPFLKAENQNYPDLIPAMELIIQGVMIGLVRGAVRNW